MGVLRRMHTSRAIHVFLPGTHERGGCARCVVSTPETESVRTLFYKTMYEVERIDRTEGRLNPCMNITVPTFTITIRVFIDHWDGVYFYATFKVEVFKRSTGVSKVVDFGSTPRYTFLTAPPPTTTHDNQFFIDLAESLRLAVFQKHEKSAKTAVQMFMNMKWTTDFFKRPKLLTDIVS
jgi:hypothetical protein